MQEAHTKLQNCKIAKLQKQKSIWVFGGLARGDESKRYYIYSYIKYIIYILYYNIIYI